MDLFYGVIILDDRKFYKLKFGLRSTNERESVRRNSRLELKTKQNGNSI
jgi:hypothetical protein